MAVDRRRVQRRIGEAANSKIIGTRFSPLMTLFSSVPLQGLQEEDLPPWDIWWLVVGGWWFLVID